MNTVCTVRRQITLWVPAPHAGPLEQLRQVLDPVQASLIPAHVTLCREDELLPHDTLCLADRVQAWPEGPVRLAFGPPQRFDGRGVLLPCVDGLAQFQRLRQWVLDRTALRPHAAHLTLAHPRNPRAPGNTDDALVAVPPARVLHLSAVALIEQTGAGPWRTLQQVTLGPVPGRR